MSKAIIVGVAWVAVAVSAYEGDTASRLIAVKTVDSITTSVASSGSVREAVQGMGEKDRSVPPLVFGVADIAEGPFKDDLKKLSVALQEEILAKLSDKPVLLCDIDSLRVDATGMLFYGCTFAKPKEVGEVDLEEQASAGSSPAVAAEAAPISTPPILHSKPGANRVIYLDFNGEIITGTAWNIDFGVSSWDCRPYSLDEDETTFSGSEQVRILAIWERVAEDYSPFNVDVTTEEPTVWNFYTWRLLITPTTDRNGNQCPHYGLGGRAYLNAFGKQYYSPAWVVDHSRSDFVAEISSHEYGHVLGLHHDGDSSREYYDGHANGQISWSSIMGDSYYENVTQWSRGEYYDANNHEDDLLIISGRLLYQPDDHGDYDVTATELAIDSNDTFYQSGIIETTGDTDVFSFSSCAGSITVNVDTYRAGSYTWGGNLDVLLELYDSAGLLLATNNPALDVNAAITLDVPIGTYYLHVIPTGVGNPMANPPTGYTSYGSLGQYWVSGVVSSDSDGDGIPDDWEIAYFLSPTGAVATADPDNDGASTFEEFVEGTNPIQSQSVFITYCYPPETGYSPTILWWHPSVEGRIYSIGWTEDLATPFTQIASNLECPANIYTDTVQRISPHNFYIITVELVQ